VENADVETKTKIAPGIPVPKHDQDDGLNSADPPKPARGVPGQEIYSRVCQLFDGHGCQGCYPGQQDHAITGIIPLVSATAQGRNKDPAPNNKTQPQPLPAPLADR